MKQLYPFIRTYILNGASSYALLALYAVTISPLVTGLIEKHDQSKFIGFFGFGMLIAEFFALRYKLKMIRIRTNIKRVQYKKDTGIDIVPSVTPGVYFAFFLRLVFHVGIVMVSMTSLGYACDESAMSPQGIIAICSMLVFEFASLIYLYFYGDFYNEPTENKREIREEIKEEELWNAENAPGSDTDNAYRLEILADIVLQVFACMLFTSFWHYLNQRGIDSVIEVYKDHLNAFEAFLSVFLLMVISVSILLRPLQIAYWIEDSVQAFTPAEKRKTWYIFLTVAIFVCSPTLFKYIDLYFIGTGNLSEESFPGYMSYIISFAAFAIVMLIQIRMNAKVSESIVAAATTETKQQANENRQTG
ncbi:MAG: hypothetical protein ACJ77K_18870 [Bacteroidia bacterium]